MELCLMLYGSLDGRGVWGKRDACICMAESFHCSPETITTFLLGYQFSSVQSLSHAWLFATPWTAACQTYLSITNFQSLLKLMSIKSVMPSNHLIFSRPLRVSYLHQSFQLIFRADFIKDGLLGSPCSPKDSQESSPTPQFKNINSSALSFLYSPTLTSIDD